jgi:signal transduction histidine kinase/CheY-like chemotaxis protein
MATAEWRFSPRTPTRSEKTAFAVLVALYAVLLLATAPWAATPGLADPRLAIVAAAAVLVADLCTALLLAIWYLSSGRPALLVLTTAYGFGAVMAGLHVVTFPGALLRAPLFGTEQTVAWLYLAWRGGISIAYVIAVALEAAHVRAAPPNGRARRLAIAGLLTLAVCAALAYAAGDPGLVAAIEGARWTNINSLIAWTCVALGGTATAVILVNRAFGEALYLWLAATIVVGAADLALGILGGERYTLGWHLARTSFVVSSYLLLAFVVGALSPQAQRRLLATIASYGSAIAAVLAALLLRWLLTPWLGASVPYITLFGAIAVAVWVGGWRPASLAAALGYAGVESLFLASPGSLVPRSFADWMHLVLFAISSVLIIGLGESMRRARDLYRGSELELRDRATQLQRADSHKSQFLAVLSHELRNPLAPLRNGLALLKLKPGAAPAERTVEMMERQIVQLTRLIEDLLDVSRIDRGKLDLRKQRIALESVARAAIETALPSIEAKQHELVVRYPGGPLFVDGDPVRLAQVIANLLNNAAKFTPPRGRIELAMRAENGMAVLSVADTGIGIAPESLGEVFGMFVQLDAGRGVSPGGLGLGLTLVRSLVAQHGGSVEAKSAGVGKGAEFIVTLPLASAASDSAPVELPAKARDSARRRILVVDDNVDAAQTLAELLRLQGHGVEAVHDGDAAICAAENLRPDVAFIDLNMPHIDGYEVARQIRSTTWGGGTKLVALTGMGQKSDLEATRAAGFDEHLTKPADLERLARIASGNVKPNVVSLSGSGPG